MGNLFTLAKFKKFLATISLTTLLASLLVVPAAHAANLDTVPDWSRDAFAALADLSQDDLRPGAETNKCEFAKMLVRAFDLEEEVVENSFTDVPSWAEGAVGAMLANNIAEGRSATEFGCNGAMSRAEQVKMTVSVLGLELCTLEDDSEFAGIEWASDYFCAAKRDGIVTGDGDTGLMRPAAAAVRAESFVMVYRAAGEPEPQEPTEPTETGGLNVKLASSTPPATNIPNDANAVAFSTFTFAATEGSATLNSVMVTRYGLGDEDDFDDVWLADENGVRVSSARSLNRDDQVSLALAGGGVMLDQGESVDLTLMAELQGATTGTLHAFGIASADDVMTSGAGVSGSFPLVGNEMEIANFTIGTLGFVANGSGKTVDVGDVEQEISEFKLIDEADTNDTDVNVRSITLELNGTIDNDNLSNLVLFHSGEAVSEVIETPESDFLAFILLDGGFLLEDGDSRTFQVRGDIIGGSDNETIIFSLDKGSDVLGSVPGLGQYSPRVVNSSSPTSAVATASNVSLNTYTLNAGDIAFAKDPSSPNNQTVASDTDDFAMATFRVSAAQEVEFNTLGFTVNLNDAGAAYGSAAAALTGGNASLDDFRLYLHGTDEAWDEGTVVASESDLTSANTTTSVNLDFDDDWNLVAGTSLLTFVSDVLPAATAGDEYSVQFDGGSGVTAEYIESGDTVASGDITGGAITGAEFTVGAATIELSRTDDNADGDALIAGAQDFFLMEVVLDNNDVEPLYITDFVFGEATDGEIGAGTALDDVSVISGCYLTDDEDTIISDDEDFSDPDATNGAGDATLTFNLDSDQEIMVGQNDSGTVRLYCNISTSADPTEYLELELGDVDAEDEDGDAASVTVGGAAVTTANPLRSAEFDVSDGGTLTVSLDTSESPDADLLVGSGSADRVDIAAYQFSAQDDNIELTDLMVRFEEDSLSSRINQLYLYDEDGNELDSASVIDQGDYSEADFGIPAANRPVVMDDDNLTLFVKARFNNISEIAETGFQVAGLLSENVVESVEAVSESTGTDLGIGSIDVVGATNSEIVTTGIAGAVTNGNTGSSTYTVASHNFKVGDSIIVRATDDADKSAEQATVTATTATTVTVNFAVAIDEDAASGDELVFGSKISAVAANVFTVPAGHGFDVNDSITFVDDANATEVEVVSSVTATTVTTVAAPTGFTVAVGDYIQATDTDKAVAETHILFNSQPVFAKATPKDTSLDYGAGDEVYRFTVAADDAGDISWKRLTFQVSQTDVDVNDFRLFPVNTNGDTQTSVPLSATTTTTATAGGGATANTAARVVTVADATDFVLGATVAAAGCNEMATVTNIPSTTTLEITPVGTWDAAACTTIEPQVGAFGGTEVSSGLVTIDLTEREEISDGSSVTYELRATTADQGNQDNDSVSVKIVTDEAIPADGTITDTFANIAAQVGTTGIGSRVIWSDQPNVATHSETSADYHNGYLVDGLDTSNTNTTN